MLGLWPLGGQALGSTGTSGVASGVTLSVATSILAGAAAGTGADQQLDVIVVGPPGRPRPPLIRQDARVDGAALVCRARLFRGRATAVSLFDGVATAEGRSREITIVRHVSLIHGAPSGERYISDEDLLLMLAEAA